MNTIAPDGLFVIACPVCRGHLAAPRNLGGRDACCPLCASLLHVPMLPNNGSPSRAAPATSLPTEPSLAEDWGRVIETLTPPSPQVMKATESEKPSDFEIPPAEGGPPAVPAPTTSAVLPPIVTATMPTASAAIDQSPDQSQRPEASAEPTSPDWIDAVLAAPELHEDPEVDIAPEGVPYFGPALVNAEEKDLEFREPVRTIRQGDTVIEIRRLTPQERSSRRFRRNLMMIVVCVSILLAIVVIFGVPTKPR